MRHFNPPAPCGAGLDNPLRIYRVIVFQSIRPVRGGTNRRNNPLAMIAISIHPPRAGRDFLPWFFVLLYKISIHPPRAGRDLIDHIRLIKDYISIHPPRAGRDQLVQRRRQQKRHFNPPAPCGAGLDNDNAQVAYFTFQSTRPVRGGTSSARIPRLHRAISIHPPRAGRDVV